MGVILISKWISVRTTEDASTGISLRINSAAHIFCIESSFAIYTVQVVTLQQRLHDSIHHTTCLGLFHQIPTPGTQYFVNDSGFYITNNNIEPVSSISPGPEPEYIVCRFNILLWNHRRLCWIMFFGRISLDVATHRKC